MLCITESIKYLLESLEVEKKVYEDPTNDFYLDVDDEDPNSGTVLYLDYEFPISKTTKFGGVEYVVGPLKDMKVFKGSKEGAFLKVKNAIMNGEVNPTQNTSNVMSRRAEPRTVTIRTLNGGEKTYKYVEPGEVDDLVMKHYETYGPEGYLDANKEYATDSPNRAGEYIPINKIARQNPFKFSGTLARNKLNRRSA